MGTASEPVWKETQCTAAPVLHGKGNEEQHEFIRSSPTYTCLFCFLVSCVRTETSLGARWPPKPSPEGGTQKERHLLSSQPHCCVGSSWSGRSRRSLSGKLSPVPGRQQTPWQSGIRTRCCPRSHPTASPGAGPWAARPGCSHKRRAHPPGTPGSWRWPPRPRSLRRWTPSPGCLCGKRRCITGRPGCAVPAHRMKGAIEEPPIFIHLPEHKVTLNCAPSKHRKTQVNPISPKPWECTRCLWGVGAGAHWCQEERHGGATAIRLQQPCLQGQEGGRLPALWKKRHGKCKFEKVCFLNYCFSKMIYALNPLVPIYLKL